ncbi:PilW family protein [Polaromonas sp. YR568]|uniref:PilW family protein n=1 Tax=Polaromonas sp. YR568 TaxID=1855301 RepID=UPI00398BF55E
MKAASRNNPRQQAGVGLIELLISMMLGLVIISALVIMYVGGGQALRNVQAQGQMNEDAQIALSVITHELRQAGYNPRRDAAGSKNDLGQGNWSLRACDTGFTTTTVNQPSVSGLVCNASGGSFALAVVYEGDLSSGKKTTAGLPMDCIGNGVAVVPLSNFYVMQARLYVENNALMCRGSGSLTGTQALAENIESMTATFAVADPAVANNLGAKGYLSASEINNVATPGLAALTLPEDRWNKVVAAQICIVVISENIVLSDLGSSSAKPGYQDCGGVKVTITDGKLRRAYRSTVLLRNHGVGYS